MRYNNYPINRKSQSLRMYFRNYCKSLSSCKLDNIKHWLPPTPVLTINKAFVCRLITRLPLIQLRIYLQLIMYDVMNSKQYKGKFCIENARGKLSLKLIWERQI